MERVRVTELHYIAPIESLRSISLHGLMSHNRAAQLPHRSIADEEVQDRRVGKRVPQGLLLHDYVNMYFDARNPMMSARRGENPNLIVVRVDPAVLDLPGAVITDGNAASSDTRFFGSPDGLAELDEQFVFAEWWTDSDFFAYLEKKRRRCSEVLVPEVVTPEHILDCYTFDNQRSAICSEVADGLLIEVNHHVFF